MIYRDNNFNNLEGIYLTTRNGLTIEKKYSLNGWIGIHSSDTKGGKRNNWKSLPVCILLEQGGTEGNSQSSPEPVWVSKVNLGVLEQVT